jgi:hypothetical protein
VLVCDGCAAVMTHPETDDEIHYETAEQARRDAVEDLCWSRPGQRDLCPVCTCAARGHRWPEWIVPVPGARVRPWRWCERCAAMEIQGQGVIGHD